MIDYTLTRARKRAYLAPASEEITIHVEGFLCFSNPDGQSTETYGVSGNTYGEESFD